MFLIAFMVTMVTTVTKKKVLNKHTHVINKQENTMHLAYGMNTFQHEQDKVEFK